MAVDFLAKAVTDQVRMTARSMAHSVTTQRDLWLKHWASDNASKHSLCLVPYDGKLLFGKALKSAIQRVPGEKSGLIHQERRRQQ